MRCAVAGDYYNASTKNVCRVVASIQQWRLLWHGRQAGMQGERTNDWCTCISERFCCCLHTQQIKHTIMFAPRPRRISRTHPSTTSTMLCSVCVLCISWLVRLYVLHAYLVPYVRDECYSLCTQFHAKFKAMCPIFSPTQHYDTRSPLHHRHCCHRHHYYLH